MFARNPIVCLDPVKIILKDRKQRNPDSYWVQLHDWVLTEHWVNVRSMGPKIQKRNIISVTPILIHVLRRSVYPRGEENLICLETNLPLGYKKIIVSSQPRKLFLREESNFVYKKVHVITSSFS